MRAFRPDVLIIGSMNDVHVQRICTFLPESCWPLVVDYSQYPKGFSASLCLGSSATSYIRTPNETICDLSLVSAVWWRRPLSFATSIYSDPQLQNYINVQSEFFWSSILSCLPSTAIWYNDRRHDYFIDRNSYQLLLARDCGLRVPDTLITSDAAEAIRFIQQHSSVIFKAYGGSHGVGYPTRLFSPEMIPLLSTTLENCPVIFQAMVSGDHDYRATIINREIQVVEFDTAASNYRYDVRVDPGIACRRIELPADITAGLFRMMELAQLRFAAIDLRTGADGHIYFLELNPAGQFTYLDDRAGTNIAELLATHLSSHVEQASKNNSHHRYRLTAPPRLVTSTPASETMPFAVAVGDLRG